MAGMGKEDTVVIVTAKISREDHGGRKHTTIARMSRTGEKCKLKHGRSGGRTCMSLNQLKQKEHLFTATKVGASLPHGNLGLMSCRIPKIELLHIQFTLLHSAEHFAITQPKAIHNLHLDKQGFDSISEQWLAAKAKHRNKA